MRVRSFLVLLAVAAAGVADEPSRARRELVQRLPWLGASESRDELDRLGKELARAQESAVRFIFDERRYPVPARVKRGWRVGVDVQPGHRDMEKRVAAAVVLHNRLIAHVAGALGAKTRTVGLEEPTLAPPAVIRSVQYYGISVLDTGAARFLKSFRRPYEAWAKEKAKPAAGDRVLHAVGALAREDWRAAVRHGGSLTGAEKALWQTLRAACVLSWNERHGGGHDAEERAGIRVANALRVALGLPPFIHDKRLHFMAGDFAYEMKRGRFFSHHHPRDPARRTPRHRARRAGYRWGVGENVSSERDAVQAVWKWRADAGHHRLLVTSMFRAAGLGCEGVSVLNVGTSTTAKILPLYGAGRSG